MSIEFESSQFDFYRRSEIKSWKSLVLSVLAAAVITLGCDMSALSNLNKFEADVCGEFGIGSAALFDSANLKLGFRISGELLSFVVVGVEFGELWKTGEIKVDVM
ncbi:hypothetical protein Hanom_Chr00s149157g01821411 [Helianthus anomalus]